MYSVSSVSLAAIDSWLWAIQALLMQDTNHIEIVCVCLRYRRLQRVTKATEFKDFQEALLEAEAGKVTSEVRY